MSEELQNDIAPVEEVETQEAVENSQDESELATETETTEQTQVSEEEKKAKAQAAFNANYGKMKQAERDRDAARAETEQLRQAQHQPPPNIGEFPNEYDYDTSEEFQDAKNLFISNVRANASFEAQQKAFQDQQAQAAQAAQQQQQQEITQKVQTFMQSAKTLDVSDSEVTQYASAVVGYGIRDDLRIALVGHPEGVMMFKHLSGNPQEVDLLNRMNPYEAGTYIENTLKAKAVALRPKTSNAPSPAQTINGAGVDPDNGKYKHLKGVKWG